jgi:hypothetical protein
MNDRFSHLRVYIIGGCILVACVLCISSCRRINYNAATARLSHDHLAALSSSAEPEERYQAIERVLGKYAESDSAQYRIDSLPIIGLAQGEQAARAVRIIMSKLNDEPTGVRIEIGFALQQMLDSNAEAQVLFLERVSLVRRQLCDSSDQVRVAFSMACSRLPETDDFFAELSLNLDSSNGFLRAASLGVAKRLSGNRRTQLFDRARRIALNRNEKILVIDSALELCQMCTDRSSDFKLLLADMLDHDSDEVVLASIAYIRSDTVDQMVRQKLGALRDRSSDPQIVEVVDRLLQN